MASKTHEFLGNVWVWILVGLIVVIGAYVFYATYHGYHGDGSRVGSSNWRSQLDRHD